VRLWRAAERCTAQIDRATSKWDHEASGDQRAARRKKSKITIKIKSEFASKETSERESATRLSEKKVAQLAQWLSEKKVAQLAQQKSEGGIQNA
jgi:hypothetical protein